MADAPRGPDWLRLDNAAKIYPPAYSDEAPEVFRVGLTLEEPVKLAPMQRALERTIHRCPYYQVHLRRGVFWYYLQRHDTPPRIEPLGTAPVSRIRMRAHRAQLFRVFVRDRLVRVDFSHVLTDASGAFRFLSTLVAEYLRQQGIGVPCGGHILDPDESPTEDEFADAYHELFIPGIPKPDPIKPAYHIPGPVVPGYHRVITGTLPVDASLAAAKSYSASLTEFLAGVYIHSIFQIWRNDRHRTRSRHAIRLLVPANMRRLHQSNTMRNFSLFLSPGIDPRLGEYPLSDVIQIVHHTMKLQLDLRRIRREISRNVGGEYLAIVRVIPLLVKDWYLSLLHHRLGPNLNSGVISNFGNVVYPESMAAHVRDISFVLGPNPTMRKAVSVVGYDSHVNIAIGSVVESRELERQFFMTLTGHGVPVRLSEQES